MVEVPLDIWYIVTALVGKSLHPLSYTIDIASLHSLCLVSRLFNALATPILYSTITLSDPRSAGCLLTTARSNPRLLQWCHSMCWLGWRLHFVEHEILSTMTGLRRFVTSQTTWHPLESIPCSTMTELAFPQLTFQMLCRQFNRYTFPNLERLYVESMSFSDESRTVEIFLKMPRLTHLVVAKLDDIHPDAKIAVIQHTPELRKMIFGRNDDVGCRRRVMERRLEHRTIQVVFLTNIAQSSDRFFGDRLVDGTLWEMDSMVYPEAEYEW
jgi:hypothetical protein